jgi:hypothetical protein
MAEFIPSASPAGRMAAALAFSASLEPEQRSQLHVEFNLPDRREFTYLPTVDL